MKKYSTMALVVGCFIGSLAGNNFVVAPKQKKQKISVEQVCRNTMPENICVARIHSLLGQNQATILYWIDDAIEEDKEALFNCATQEQLQKFNQAEQEYVTALEQFEEMQHKRREFLKQWKQEVLAPKKGKAS